MTGHSKNYKNNKDRNNGGRAAGRGPAVSAGAGKKRPVSGRCRYAGRCGGCSMIDIPMEEQLKIRQQIVEDAIGDIIRPEPVIRMKNPDRYRHKVTSVFGLDNAGHPVCGVYRERSRQIVPVKDCLIEDKYADRIIRYIYEMLQPFRLRVFDDVTGRGTLRAVQVRTAYKTDEVLVTLVTAGPMFPGSARIAEALAKEFPRIRTVVQNINERRDAMILGEREKVLLGPGYIEDELCGRRFRISSRSFYQVNPLQAEKLYRISIDMAGLSGKETLLDAYCGTGTIGICAADRCRRVIGVESNPEAVRDAQHNIRLNGLENVEILEDDAGAFLRENAASGSHVDVLLMDPPRAGASEEFLEAVLAMRPEKIVYVSCNPETLGRDLRILTANDAYRAVKAVPVDMFPHTKEVEVVSFLQRMSNTWE